MAWTGTKASIKEKPDKKSPAKKTAVMKLRESKQAKRTRITRIYDRAPRNPFSKQATAWMLTMIHLEGGFRFPLSAHTYLPVIKVGDQYIEWSRLSPALRNGLVFTKCKDEIDRRFGRLSRPLAALRKASRPEWEIAYGSEKSLPEQARFYIELIDHKEMEKRDSPTIVLAKTVCNLRNCYARSKEQTIELIQGRYNELSRVNWSAEDIALPRS